MPSALFLLQYVYLSFEVRMRMDRPRRRQHLSALDLIPLDPPQQRSDVVPCYRFIQQLSEHLYARDYRRLLLFAQPYDLYRILYLHRAALYASRCYRTTARDREYVLYRHQERLVAFTLRRRNVRVYRFHQFEDRFAPFVALYVFPVLHRFQCFQRRPFDHRNVIARELVAAQQIPDLHLYQLQQLFIVYHVHLVHEHYDVRHPYLSCQQNVLPRLRHRAVRCAYYQDRTVHLCCPCNHVLYIVRMARAVYVRIVPRFRFILYVRCVDRDPTLFFFRRFVNLVILCRFRLPLLRQYHRDRRRQRRLPMVYMTNRSDIYMRFRTFKFSLRHFWKSPLLTLN